MCLLPIVYCLIAYSVSIALIAPHLKPQLFYIIYQYVILKAFGVRLLLFIRLFIDALLSFHVISKNIIYSWNEL